MKKNKGVTLISLLVTIIILIILAGISITALQGDNGIIRNANEAKEETEIASEKEIVDISVIQSVGDNKKGNLEKTEFENRIKRNAGKQKVNLLEDSDNFVVEFIEKERFYQVDKEGNVEGPIVKIEDEFAGDITKGGRLDGSLEKPYEISCIEDLVSFSEEVNSGNNYYNKNIILTRTLDFESMFSYNDPKTTKYGDLNTNGVVEDIKAELTNKSEGCIGFTPIGKNSDARESIFNVNIDGLNNEIKKIYINTIENAGLIGGATDCKIKNLGISGKIKSTEENAGGIIATGRGSNIYNCYNKANVSSYMQSMSGTGGIIGSDTSANIEKCYNYGIIESIKYAGGISGRGGNKIKDCNNYGKIISSSDYAGGIVGEGYGTIKIVNSINFGNVSGTWIVGGIVGDEYEKKTYIENCCNLGEIYLSNANVSYSGVKGLGGNFVKNSYSFGKLSLKKGTNINTNNCKTIGADNLDKCYYNSDLVPEGALVEQGAIDVKGKTMEEVVNLLNSYTDETGKYPTEWKKWKIGENGYPTFE